MLQIIILAVGCSAVIGFAVFAHRGAEAVRRIPSRRARYEPGWTDAYASQSGLILAHEHLDSDSCPTPQQLADIAGTWPGTSGSDGGSGGGGFDGCGGGDGGGD